jgi:hypothetical protein
MIQSKGVPQFSGTDTKKTISIFVEEVIQLLE